MEEHNEINTKYFGLKVLTCIYDLQMIGESTCGVIIDEIVEQMCRRFVTDGDVEAQVRVSLKQVCHKGLVGKHRDRYKLVGPVARIMLMKHKNCQRKHQIEKIQRIFFNHCVDRTNSSQKFRLMNSSKARFTSEEQICLKKPSQIQVKHTTSKNENNEVVVKDLVDFLQHNPNCSTSKMNYSSTKEIQSAETQEDVITVLGKK